MMYDFERATSSIPSPISERDKGRGRGFAKILLLFLIIIFIALGIGLLNFNFMDKKIIKINKTEFKVEIADNTIEQYQGLSGRDLLCQDCAMLFVYKNAGERNFWMKDMKFLLDIIFIRDKKIIEIFENVEPVDGKGDITKIKSREPADMVLEINAGATEKNGIRVGNTVEF